MLLDTSGLLCLIDVLKPLNPEAIQMFDKARRPLVHNYVLAELFPLAYVRGVRRQSVQEFVADLLRAPEINVHWVDRRLHEKALQLLVDRPIKRTPSAMQSAFS